MWEQFTTVFFFFNRHVYLLLVVNCIVHSRQISVKSDMYGSCLINVLVRVIHSYLHKNSHSQKKKNDYFSSSLKLSKVITDWLDGKLTAFDVKLDSSTSSRLLLVPVALFVSPEYFPVFLR